MLRTVIVAALIVIACAGVCCGVGEVLSAPALHSVGDAPGDLGAVSVHIAVGSGSFVAGWFAPGREKGGAVLLLHGVHADRTQMLERARALHGDGYAVLLIDLPAEGESPATRITFGARESVGVSAALGFLHERLPNERMGVIGVSLGAASFVLSHPRPSLDAVVLESMYPTIREAVEDRLAIYLGPAGRGLGSLLLWQLPWRLGVSEDDLRPINAIAQLGSPVLIAAGTADRNTTLAETLRLYGAAAAPKRLWRVEGAAHVDLHAFAPAAYRAEVFGFLAEHLRGPS